MKKMTDKQKAKALEIIENVDKDETLFIENIEELKAIFNNRLTQEIARMEVTLFGVYFVFIGKQRTMITMKNISDEQLKNILTNLKKFQ